MKLTKSNEKKYFRGGEIGARCTETGWQTERDWAKRWSFLEVFFGSFALDWFAGIENLEAHAAA